MSCKAFFVVNTRDINFVRSKKKKLKKKLNDLETMIRKFQMSKPDKNDYKKKKNRWGYAVRRTRAPEIPIKDLSKLVIILIHDKISSYVLVSSTLLKVPSRIVLVCVWFML